MKNIIIFSTFIAIIILSCEKEPEFYWGDMHAIRNGEIWTSDLYSVNNINFNDLIDIILDNEISPGVKIDGLHFSKIKPQTGINILYNTTLTEAKDSSDASYVTILDGDILGNFYNLDETKNNYVEIIHYDEETKIIEGKFQATFIIEKPRSKYLPNDPDTVKFTEAYFKTKVRGVKERY